MQHDDHLLLLMVASCNPISVGQVTDGVTRVCWRIIRRGSDIMLMMNGCL